MANENNQYTPFIHLATDVIQAGSTMIECIGALTACRRYEERFELTSNPKSPDWEALRKAVQSASAALRNYDALVLSDLAKVTREQFDDAAEAL